MMMKERKELFQRIQKKDVVQDLLYRKSEDYAICKYDDKVGWHLLALTMKSLIILKLNFCIGVDITNIIAILKWKTPSI